MKCYDLVKYVRLLFKKILWCSPLNIDVPFDQSKGRTFKRAIMLKVVSGWHMTIFVFKTFFTYIIFQIHSLKLNVELKRHSGIKFTLCIQLSCLLTKANDGTHVFLFFTYLFLFRSLLCSF